MFSHSYLITDMLFLPHRYLSYLLCGTVFLLLLSPSSAFGLHSPQEGASLCPLSLSLSSSSVLFYFTSVQAAHLFWLARVQYRVGRCGRKENLKKKKKKEGGGDDDGGWSLKKAISSKDTHTQKKVLLPSKRCEKPPVSSPLSSYLYGGRGGLRERQEEAEGKDFNI